MFRDHFLEAGNHCHFYLCDAGVDAAGADLGPCRHEPAAGRQRAVRRIARLPVRFDMPKSRNPLNAYSPDYVPEPVLANSPRLDRLIREGKLYLALKDAINLALENNLDLAIARYNLPIANTDILRTEAGGFFRGVNTGVVQGTPGGGVGGFGTGAPGAGAGGTTERRGRSRSRRVRFSSVHSRAPEPLVSSYDPFISANGGDEHQTSPVANPAIYGVPSLQIEHRAVQHQLLASLCHGTSINFSFNNARQTTNSPFFTLSPTGLPALIVSRSNRNSSPDSVSARTCAICELPETIKRFQTSLSRIR